MIYRIDKFIVPPAAMSAFMARARKVQSMLGALPGCGQNLVLTQTGGPGEFNVVTIAEWADERALADAKASMQAHYAQEGFDADAFMKQLGVRADLGVYATGAG